MVNFVVEPTALNSGTIGIPGDKSISHRALMLGAIADGQSRIRGFLPGADCLATMEAIRSLGVGVKRGNDSEVLVNGVGRDGLQASDRPIDLGNSGTAMRLLTGLLAGQRFSSRLVGDASLSRRPMDRVIRPLEQMGARIASSDGRPPLDIEGSKLHGLVYRMPVASAQVKSAILLAGLYAGGEVAVIEPSPTRDHTERMLRTMGAQIDIVDTQVVLRGGQDLTPAEIDVPADLSSASFFLLAAILSDSAEIRIPAVGVNPTRTGVLEILRQMGADISVDNVRLFGEEPVADLTARPSTLRGIDVDPELVPLAIDEFPLLFVAAASAEGKTTFSGIGELRVKESDRIATMASGLRALSVAVEESEDGAVVHGGKIYGGMVDSGGDHRVAMSFAIAATVAEWTVTIRNVDMVGTSFPGFADLLGSLGGGILATEDKDGG